MKFEQLLPRRLCTGSCCVFDVSKIQELSLHLYELTDVSGFSNLTWLSLSCCPGIRDVPSLGNVSNLIIDNCPKIRDISSLQNNKTLSIYNCGNISLSTVNFMNVLHLSTDLNLPYTATTTVKNAVSLELLYFHCSAIFMSSTVVSVEIKNTKKTRLPLHIDLSNFSPSLKFVLLEYVSSRVDLTPLGNVE
jgi:hypothetical protein